MTDRLSDRAPAGRLRLILTDQEASLHRPTEAVRSRDAAVGALVADLRATMAAHAGMGLAAPQIGIPWCVAVVRVATVEIVLIDPVIVTQRGRQAGWEGCLSIPDRMAWVVRPAEVVVSTLDLEGRCTRVRATDLVARAVVHEIVHLRGRLYSGLVAPDALVDTREHPTPPPRSHR
ncbi:MAG: peptide deformylase [Candidatus Limnocylindrales bacterium]